MSFDQVVLKQSGQHKLLSVKKLDFLDSIA
jgi:hypothetical protein